MNKNSEIRILRNISSAFFVVLLGLTGWSLYTQYSNSLTLQNHSDRLTVLESASAAQGLQLTNLSNTTYKIAMHFNIDPPASMLSTSTSN